LSMRTGFIRRRFNNRRQGPPDDAPNYADAVFNLALPLGVGFGA
jgi:hypothetical protein